MKKATVKRMSLPENRRILAVSDVHGNLELFREALRGAGFCRDDVLFILGDLLEKGAESLALLRYVMDLTKEYEVYPVCGNCDDLVIGFVDGREELTKEFYDFYLNAWGERCTLVQMGMEAGLAAGEMADYGRFAGALRERFGPELDFLRAMPVIVDTPGLVLVHGGVPSTERMEELEAWRCMKNDDFLHQDVHLDKWCVVGHWPVTLYNGSIPCSNPLVDREKKIVSIDGGCSLKPDGQINLLDISRAKAGEFSFTAWDGLEETTALDAQQPSEDSVNILWSENRVEILERGTEFSRCRHTASGRTLDILNSYLFRRRGVLCCEGYTDYRLGVAPGERLKVVERTSRGLLAKKNGVTGWYLGRTEDKKQG